MNPGERYKYLHYGERGLSKEMNRPDIRADLRAAAHPGILAASLSTSYAALVVIMIFVGLGDSGRRTLNNALIMEQVDDEHRGRVMVKPSPLQLVAAMQLKLFKTIVEILPFVLILLILALMILKEV